MKGAVVPRSAGFTLIELMVAIAVAAVLLAVAVPGFTAFQRNSELAVAVNGTVASLNAARSEAMKRGRRAYMVPQDGARWASGWVVFVDGGDAPDQRYDATDDITVQTQAALPGYFSVVGSQTANESPPYVMFDPSGYPLQKSGGFGSLSIVIARNDLGTGSASLAQTRRIIISPTGRIRTCRPASANDDNCPANITNNTSD